jgi:hypothetical protein
MNYHEIMRHCSAITREYDHSDIAELDELDSSDRYLLKQKIIGCLVSLSAMMGELEYIEKQEKQSLGKQAEQEHE